MLLQPEKLSVIEEIDYRIHKIMKNERHLRAIAGSVAPKTDITVSDHIPQVGMHGEKKMETPRDPVFIDDENEKSFVAEQIGDA